MASPIAPVVPLDPSAPWVVAPPPRPVAVAGGLGQTLVGALGSLGMVGFAIVGGNRLFLFIAIGLAALTVAGAVGSRLHGVRSARASSRELRRRWREHLALQAAGARQAGDAQRGERLAAHPGVGGLLARARGGVGLWWESSDAEEPWRVRVGTGIVPARQPLTSDTSADPLAEIDRELADQLSAAIALGRQVDEAPVVYSWPPGSVLAIVGPLDDARSVARAIIAELLVRRPPGRLRVTVDTAAPAEWNWLAWVPHDAALGARAGPGELLIRDGDGAAARAPAGTAAGVSAAAQASAAAGGSATRSSAARVLLLAPRLRSVPAGAQTLDLASLPCSLPGGELVASWAGLDTERAAGLARALAPRAQAGRPAQRLGDLSVFDLMESAPRSRGPDLRAPLGVADGVDLWLDLREPAAGGDGPHGLLIGATGSGKSELLRSLVLGLAWRHPPEELAFVLADWKGGAAFDDVAALPHVAGLMTNLSDDRGQVTRVAGALRAELTRRQLLLRSAEADSVEALRRRDPAAAPPALVVVLDEFGELLAAEPDILDTLVACGRLGRSLGVHLLLSSQRFEEGRLRGLESHLRYRVCLRVSTPSESLGVIGSPDAAALPSEPGWGYLSVDGRSTRFRAAHTSRPALDRAAAPPPVRPLALVHREIDRARGAETERARAVRVILGLGRPRVAPVWHPPLPATVSWPTLTTPGWSLPLGVADDVAGQTQPPWTLDLETCGHIGVVGGPGAGASSLLRTVMLAGVESLTASELGLIVADFGGLDRSGLAELRHLRCLAGPEDPDLALAALRWAAQIVEARGQHARRHAVTGPGGWRRARETRLLPALPGDTGADLLVVVDGLARARDDLEEIDALLGVIAGGGLRVRVRLLVAAQRWGDFRPALRDLLGTRWELRLADVGESGFPREVAARLAGAPPGRVVTADGVLAQSFQPPSTARSRGGTASARLLPLPAVISGRPASECAVRAGDLAVLGSDARGHLLVLGDRGSGRTSLLRRIATACSADPLARRVTILDPRRGLTSLAQRPGVRWTSGGADSDAVIAELVELLTRRRQGSPTADPRRSRWWSGPEHLVVVDDADLIPGGAYGGALAPLAEFVRIGPDLGFGIALARPVTGLARNGFEPFTAAVRECAVTTVLLRGDPGEGAVAGGLRARPDRLPGRCSWITDAGAVDAQLIFDPEPLISPAGRESVEAVA